MFRYSTIYIQYMYFNPTRLLCRCTCLVATYAWQLC